jgi:hypothetical protein
MDKIVQWRTRLNFSPNKIVLDQAKGEEIHARF